MQHVVKMEAAILEPDAVLDRQIKTPEKRLELFVKIFPDTHVKCREAREQLQPLYDQVHNQLVS